MQFAGGSGAVEECKRSPSAGSGQAIRPAKGAGLRITAEGMLPPTLPQKDAGR
jgi:hypothetical protein